MRLFEEGRRMMEDICGVPVLGVVPFTRDIHIEEEDSVSLDSKRRHATAGKVNIAVVLLRHISNFTDFDMLEKDPRVNLYYTGSEKDLEEADIVIIPGSKATLDDLYELRRNGLAKAILSAAREGKTVMGICGGYQIMGLEVSDPDGVEGEIKVLPGLGLLPIRTTLSGSKTTRQVEFTFDGGSDVCRGYEIHMGETRLDEGSRPLCILSDGQPDGCRASDNLMGTYIHGILDNGPVIEAIIGPYTGDKKGAVTTDYTAYKEEQYDALATMLREHIDIDRLYKIMSEDD